MGVEIQNKHNKLREAAVKDKGKVAEILFAVVKKRKYKGNGRINLRAEKKGGLIIIKKGQKHAITVVTLNSLLNSVDGSQWKKCKSKKK